MKADDNVLRYDRMIEAALRGVVRQSVEEIITRGSKMPGNHHFYITFLTDHAGVKIPKYLRDRYPGEMTIVLQHQFKDLKVDAEFLHVTLSFNNTPEALKVPFASIKSFADPSVNFILQFQPVGEDGAEDDITAMEGPDDDGPDSDGPGTGGKPGSKGKKKAKAPTGEVISIDKFRKK